MVPEVEKKQTLDERLAGLINKEPIMIFIKGSPSAPKCGFSGKLISLLDTEGVKYGSFDILSDEEVLFYYYIIIVNYIYIYYF